MNFVTRCALTVLFAFAAVVLGASAHAAGDNHIDTQFMQEVRQKTRPVPRIGNACLGNDFTVLRLKDVEVFAMAEMARDHGSFACNRDFH